MASAEVPKTFFIVQVKFHENGSYANVFCNVFSYRIATHIINPPYLWTWNALVI